VSLGSLYSDTAPHELQLDVLSLQTSASS